jgi:hypothetical protein
MEIDQWYPKIPLICNGAMEGGEDLVERARLGAVAPKKAIWPFSASLKLSWFEVMYFYVGISTFFYESEDRGIADTVKDMRGTIASAGALASLGANSFFIGSEPVLLLMQRCVWRTLSGKLIQCLCVSVGVVQDGPKDFTQPRSVFRGNIITDCTYGQNPTSEQEWSIGALFCAC